MATLSVIIVSYNVRHYLHQCLDSVVRATKGLEADIWVVDNASSDDSVSVLGAAFPQVHFVQNTTNVGFARANNQAIRQSQGDYVLLLNPDTIVGEETLHTCLQLLETHPHIGATGTRMLNRDGSFAAESRRGVPTPMVSFYKVSGLCRLFPRSRTFGRYYMRYLDENQTSAIEVMSGAFMMLRREALEEAGLLCEDYFMYGEDIDLSYTLLGHGWENWYTPAHILHYKGESTQKTSLRYVQTFYNAMLIFFDKHFAHRYRLMALLIRLAVVLKGAADFCLRRLHKLLKRLTPQRHEAPERLLFVGSDEAWDEVQRLCHDHGYEVVRCPYDAAHLGHVSDYAHSHQVLYALYQTDAEVASYDTILDLMQLGHHLGMRVHLATYSSATHTILLPGDILTP